MAMVEATPELSLYAKQMWLRHEKSLAKAIQQEIKTGTTALESEAIARFVLDSFYRALGDEHPEESLKALFAILKKGWNH